MRMLVAKETANPIPALQGWAGVRLGVSEPEDIHEIPGNDFVGNGSLDCR
jgi:hypothetical protein